MRILLILLMLVSACGKKPSDHHAVAQKEESVEGLFTGEFVALNPREVNHPVGVAKINVMQDEFHIIIAITNLPPVTHFQSIRIGSACPRLKDEGNIDLEIDSTEVSAQTSPILIPLDADLETQARGARIFPFGNYRYEKIVSYSQMLADLHGIDQNPDDDMMKLDLADLPMDHLVVIVEGVTENFTFPETVVPRHGMTIAASQPIACAKLVRGNLFPDEPDINPPPRPRPAPLPVPPPEPPPAPPEEPHRGTFGGRIGGVIFRTWCRIYHCEER